MPYYSTVKLKAISDRKAANRPTTTLLQVRSGMTFLAHATRSPPSNIEGGTLVKLCSWSDTAGCSFLHILFQMLQKVAPNCEVRSSPRAQLAPTNNPLFRGRVGPWGRCSDATETNMLQGMPWGAICVQSSDDSRNSAIRTAYRISLRSSSLREPRYPLLGVLFWLLFLCFLLLFLRRKVRNCCNQQLEIRRGWW